MKQVEAHLKQLFEQAHNHTGNDWSKELEEFKAIMAEVMVKVMPEPKTDEYNLALADIKANASKFGLRDKSK